MTAIPIITAQSISAISADSFVESIGINTHWAFPNVYAHNYTGLKVKLAESGIRYVRDRTHTSVYERANDLYNSLGIKTNMLTGRYEPGPWPSPLDSSQIDAELNEIKTQALTATISLEGPNEYDHVHGPDVDWVGSIKNYSTLLYTKAKADELLRNLPIIGPSLTSLKSYEAVGDSDSYIDYANLHIYQGSYEPGTDGWYNNGTGSLTWFLNELARRQSPSGKRVQATETGHHNYLPSDGVSEEADGKYMARILAEYFRRGIYRTYKYELIDEGQPGMEGVFGLLRNDLSEKSGFRAVKNLITILTDKGPPFQPSTLNYVLNGSMDNVRQILFQKRNGDFYLMVWMEVSSWNVTTKNDLSPPPQQVRLTLHDSNKISSAILHAFNNSADVNTVNLTINNNQVTFNVTDKISIIKLSNSTIAIPHGLYRLTPKSALHSCLEATAEHNHASVIQSQYWGSFNQQWITEPVKDGYYRLINRASGRSLSIGDCNAENGSTVESIDCQTWKFEPLLNDYYRISSKHTHDQYLEVQLYSSDDYKKIQQSSWLNSNCQQWKLDRIA